MDIKAYIEQIRRKKKDTEKRKANHDKFVENFIRSAGKKAIVLATGVALSGNIDANATELHDQLPSENKSEKLASTNLCCPVLNRVYDITYEECHVKHDVESFVSHKNKAGYYPNYDHIVCETFHLSDKEAYKIGNGGADEFDDALIGFKSALTKHKYTGKMPKTLDDVREILEKNLSGMKEKQQGKIADAANELGLSNALKIKNVTDNANKDHTDEKTVNHEHIHAKNAPILKKALLPSTLVSPQHLFLLYAADEIEAQLNGKTAMEDVVAAVNKLKTTNTTNYAMNWQESVEAHTTEIKTYYPQNLDITEDGILVDNFSQKNFEKFLKEMIPNDNLRNMIKASFKEVQKLKPKDEKQGFYADYTSYGHLKADHNSFLRRVSAETVKFEKENPYTDSYAKETAEKRNNAIVQEYGKEHYANLTDNSQNYVLDENGTVKKQEKDNAKENQILYVAGFDYNR